MKVDCFKIGSISTDRCNISRVQIRMNICKIDAFKSSLLKYRFCTINQTNIFAILVFTVQVCSSKVLFLSNITTKNFIVAFFSVLLSAIFKAGYFESSIKAIMYQSAQRIVFSYVV